LNPKTLDDSPTNFDTLLLGKLSKIGLNTYKGAIIAGGFGVCDVGIAGVLESRLN